MDTLTPSARPGVDSFVLEDLILLQRRLSRQVSTALAEDGATVDAWRLLRLLADGVPRQMGEIARSLCMPDASATRLVGGLAERSLLYRRQSEQDRRRISVNLSRLGGSRLERWDAIVQAHQDALLTSPAWSSVQTGLHRLLTDEAAEGPAS